MILFDDSVWMGHFRRDDPGMVQVLESGLAAVHPYVMGKMVAAWISALDLVRRLQDGEPSMHATPSPTHEGLVLFNPVALARRRARDRRRRSGYTKILRIGFNVGHFVRRPGGTAMDRFGAIRRFQKMRPG